MPKARPLAIHLDVFEAKHDTRTLTERLADVLAESRREDTQPEFRLGLLQGALEIALPQLTAAPIAVKATAARARRSRRHA